jgi:predicted DsbA family dithiol-disulfide isomerase
MIQIDLFSDVICPWCFIGKRRLERALKERPEVKVNINWRAFQLNPDMPRLGMSRESYLETKFGGPERAKSIYDNIRKAGKSEGLDFKFEKIKQTPNTVLAHRLIAWSKQLHMADKVVEALFSAYFFEGQDISSIETLNELVEGLDINAKYFVEYINTEEGASEVSSETKYAYENGITGVPCFIFNKKYALSGAQEPESFFPLFDLNLNGEVENQDLSGNSS